MRNAPLAACECGRRRKRGRHARDSLSRVFQLDEHSLRPGSRILPHRLARPDGWLVTVCVAIMIATAGANATGDDVAPRSPPDKPVVSAEPVDAGTYQRIVDAHRDDPHLQQFQRRLDTIARLSEQLATSFAALRQKAFDGLLDDVDDVSAAPPTSSPAPTAALVSASALVDEHRAAFASALQAPDLPASDLKLLRTYYHQSVTAMADHIAAEGELVDSVDPAIGRQVIELCLVVPLLHYADQQWSAQRVDQLSAWLKRERSLAALELFALKIRRPQTAYVLYQARQKARKTDEEPGEAANAIAMTDPATPDASQTAPGVTQTAPGETQTAPDASQTAPATNQRETGPTDSLVDYLSMAAGQLTDQQAFHTALFCLKTAVAEATRQGLADKAAALGTQTAALLDQLGHPQAAADEMGELAAAAKATADYARAITLRIKYLFRAEAYGQLNKEAAEHLADPRTSAYTPQIIYLHWLSHRRLGNRDAAAELRSRFIKQFPDHPLCADFHFAAALHAIAADDYAEAARHLEIIEYRFESSRIAPRAKDMQTKVAAALQAAEDRSP